MDDQPTVVYWDDAEHLYVRFEGVEHEHFHLILSAFRNRFPDAKWVSQYRAWQVSKANDFQEVAVFAYQFFGRSSLRLREADSPRQLELPFATIGAKSHGAS